MFGTTHSLQRSTRKLLTYSCVCLLALIVSGSVVGQTEPKYTSNQADQVLRGTGRVNPSSLGMEIQIPLGSYLGRGVSVPINLSYSSKVWRMLYNSTEPKPGQQEGCNTKNTPLYADRTASGWNNSLEVPYLEYTGREEVYDNNGVPWSSAWMDDGCVAQPDHLAYIKRIVVHLPGGETHELRVDDAVVSYAWNSLCPGVSCDSYDPSQQANWNATFYATDGSNLKYVEDSTTSPATYKLLMPDGSYYNFSSSSSYFPSSYENIPIRKAAYYYDRNGNYIAYHDAVTGHPNGYVTDTLGRTLDLPFSPTAPTTTGDVSYEMPGLGSGTVTYHLIWKLLKDTTSAASALTNYSDSLKYAGCNYYTGSTWAFASGTLFCGSGSNLVLQSGSTFNPIVLSEIDLPNGTSYKFTYDVYGRIERIYYPTGGDEVLTYSQVAPLAKALPGNITDQTNFGVTDRKVYTVADTGTPSEWTYSITNTGGYSVQTTNPDGTATQRFLLGSVGSCYTCSSTWGYDTPLAGMPYEERSFDSGGHLIGLKLTHWTDTQYSEVNGGATNGVPEWNPRMDNERSYTYDTSGAGVYTTKKYEYENSLANRTDPMLVGKVTEWNYETTSGGSSITPSSTPLPSGTPVPSASPARSTESTYLIDDSSYSGVVSYYTAQNMKGLVTVSKVKDPSGTIVSQSQMVYDESGSSPGYRGNVTTAKAWDSTKGVVTSSSNFIATHAGFDAYGNQTSATDANGNTTTTTFDSLFNAFPVTITSPIPDSAGTYGSSTAFTTTNAYDLPTSGSVAYSGLLLATTDANGLKTETTYDSTTLRPTYIKTYDTTTSGSPQVGGTKEIDYTDTPGSFAIETRSQIDSTHYAEAYKYFDGLGRVIRTRKVDTGGDDYTLICYDSSSRVAKTTNPFRSYSTQDCSTTSGLDWTSNTYDAAGRPWKVTTPDTAVVETDYGVATSGSQIGTTVTVTDQAGKTRRSITNGLGQLIRVDEPTTSGLGTISSPNQATTYAYDTLNNLTGVTQGSQSRSFSYSSLARLTSATNPESGTISYTYDDGGNLYQKTDARSITTTYTYDHLNRVKQRSYSDSTPTVTYYYDNLTYGNGKLKKVTNSNSTTEYTSYDILGRVTGHKQTTASTDYTTAYTYNLADDVLEETYPSGRMVRNSYDSDGSLSQVETKPSGGSYATRASNFSYNPSEQITSLELGNSRWESTDFNSRLHPTRIALGTTQGGYDLLKLDYTYGVVESGTLNTAKNNGNIQSQTITVPTVGSYTGFTAIQTYNYDDLNRLSDATETVSGSQTWKQEFSYDRYANRNFVTGTGHTTTLGGCAASVCNPSFNTSTNRFSSGQGWAYDSSGNITADGTGNTFLFDAENKQTQAKDPANTTIGQYYYDGDGHRVEKISSGDSTIFVYDAFGRRVEEFLTSAPTTVSASYTYADERLLTRETASATNYLTVDGLGTPRIDTDSSGNVVARHDYHPFGEEIFTSNRISSLGYASDGIRQRFAGKQRDDETGLDYFEARYYSSAVGRFSSPDEFSGGPDELFDFAEDAADNPTFYADPSDPQSLNKYQYTYNNPLNMRDDDGHCPECAVLPLIPLIPLIPAIPVEIVAVPPIVLTGQVLTGPTTYAPYEDPYSKAKIGDPDRVGPNRTIPEVQPAPRTQPDGGGNRPNRPTPRLPPFFQPLLKNKPAPGKTSSGRPTDKRGRPLGPSGKPMIHNVPHPSKKAAKDAARKAGNGAPMQHPSPQRGKPHFHPTRDGEKKPDGTHYNYPK